jgi:hypothetical protein
MPRFLVESYVAETSSAFDRACAQARRTARLGVEVTYVHTTALPGEETVLHHFDAPSADVLETAGRAAGLEFERIAEATHDAADHGKETST